LILSALEPSIPATTGSSCDAHDVRLTDIETGLREPALRDLLSQIPVPIDLWRSALVHRGERRVKQDHERTMMLSVTWPLNISPGQLCIYAGRGDVVGHCSTKPYSATTSPNTLT
jgi:hypothetical protein